ncbi:MAG TPA: PKD domain-containing protein [Candidatus Nitrosopolaris sp.]|nr:PKD domain-containing protein [Candidatus Nitrosopolaris sp.]
MKALDVDLVMYAGRQAAEGRFLKRRAVRRFLTLIVAGSLWLAAAGTVQAATAGKLDANFQPFTFNVQTATNRQMLAQTFKAISTGQIDQVSLPEAVTFGGSGDIYVVPVDASTGKPSTSYSSTAHYSGFVNCCAWVDYTITPKFAVTATSQYAIVVMPSVGSFSWTVSKILDYPDGQLWMGNKPSSWSYFTNMGYDFPFRTYVVAGAANQAPAISVNNASVPVGEGAAPSNSGTYGDADGDTVTLAATTSDGSAAGTVTPNAATGTWSWKGAPADEGTSQTITITASDSAGLKTPITFTTVVGSVTPKVAISGAPASSPEGKSITLTASASSDSAEDNAAGFKYVWVATKNGGAYGSGTGATFAVKPNDEGAYVVTLQATDDGGLTGTASVSIVGANVPPTASFVSVTQPTIVMVSQESLTFTGTFSDPGVLDSHTVTWKFGDGGSSTTAIPAGGPTTFSTTHSYTKSGYFYADLTVTDDDGGASSTVGTTVDILSPAEAIGRIGTVVQSLKGLNAGQKSSLQVKLNAATDAYARGNAGAACNQLGAFVNEVDAQQQAGHITSTEQGILTSAARATQLSMGCFRTLVEFLSGL